jgi:hypothetical protein
MTPVDRLAAIGRALYGRDWKQPLAADLGYSRQAIHYWLSGKTPLPEDHPIFARARAKLMDRVAELRKAIDLA